MALDPPLAWGEFALIIWIRGSIARPNCVIALLPLSCSIIVASRLASNIYVLVRIQTHWATHFLRHISLISPI
jgi:hypothetical protein